MTKHETEDYKISAVNYYLNNDRGDGYKKICKIFDCKKSYMDMKDDFIIIYDKYYLKDKIEFHEHTPSILERPWKFV